MLKEALELIQTTAQQAKAAKRLDVPGDGRKAFFDVYGQITAVDVDPPLRKHMAGSLEDLAGFVDTSDSGQNPVLWISPGGVVAILDDRDRRDRIEFHLEHSREFSMLMLMDKESRPMPHRRFVKFLQIDMAGSLEDLNLIAKFRQLDWENGAKGQSVVTRGKESLGKEIVAKIQGIDDLPEQMVVHVPVFRNQGERQRRELKLAIDIDVSDQTIAVIPLPGEIDAAIEEALGDIRSRLRGILESVPVYMGTP